MSNIARILDRYEDYEVADIMMDDNLARDIQILEKELPNASKADEKRIKAFLNELILNINAQINTLNDELAKKPESLQRIQKSSDACLAYSKPTGKKG